MLKFWNYDIVFAEVPDHTTLAVNLTGCPLRCPGCHSPHLREDVGDPLDDDALAALLARYGSRVTCVALIGGDAAPAEVEHAAREIRRLCPALAVAWYSGRDVLPDLIDRRAFDYIKLGGWVESLGGLASETTNQRMYRILADGTAEDITPRFRR